MKENKYAYAMEILSAASDGKPLQWSDDGGKIWDDNPHFGSIEVDHLNDPFTIRLKPSSKMVPLELSDIRPGMAIRHVGSIDWITIYAAYQSGIQTYRGDNLRPYSELMDRWEYSLDGVTWHRCEKEANG